MGKIFEYVKSLGKEVMKPDNLRGLFQKMYDNPNAPQRFLLPYLGICAVDAGKATSDDTSIVQIAEKYEALEEGEKEEVIHKIQKIAEVGENTDMPVMREVLFVDVCEYYFLYGEIMADEDLEDIDTALSKIVADVSENGCGIDDYYITDKEIVFNLDTSTDIETVKEELSERVITILENLFENDDEDKGKIKQITYL